MSDGIYSALSGAVAQARALDVVANNVANASTTGFRADRVSFQEELSQVDNGSPNPNALRYVVVSQVRMDDQTGPIEQTGNHLDLALQGEGWFTIDTPQGERFTRAGSFLTNEQGQLVTQEGHLVAGLGEGEARRIVIPQDAGVIQVGRDGSILADGAPVGTLRLRRFAVEEVEKEGSTMVRATAAGEPSEAEVLQGYLERSNLNAVAGLNDLIHASRSFEAFQKVIRSYRQIDERTARELGRGT